jgi:glycosyltransferase involved in cell wall biosynthesis
MNGISVLVPIFNGAEVVHQAIGNILCQSLLPGEVVLADDGSTDGLAHLLADLGARCERQGVLLTYVAFAENRGRGAARNLALDGASGDLVAWYDVDDLWAEDKLAEGVASFSLLQHENPPGQLLLTCNYCRYEEDPVGSGATIRPPPVMSIDDVVSIYGRRHVQLQTVMGPRSTFMSFRFDEELNRAEDFDFALRFTAAGGKFVNPNSEGPPLVHYFRSRDNWSMEAVAANRLVLDKQAAIFRSNHVDPVQFLEQKLKRLLQGSKLVAENRTERPQFSEAPVTSTIYMTQSGAVGGTSLRIVFLPNGDVQFHADSEVEVRYVAVGADLATVVCQGHISFSAGIPQSRIAFWFLKGARVLEIEADLGDESTRERFRLVRARSGAISARISQFGDLEIARALRKSPEKISVCK